MFIAISACVSVWRRDCACGVQSVRAVPIVCVWCAVSLCARRATGVEGHALARQRGGGTATTTTTTKQTSEGGADRQDAHLLACLLACLCSACRCLCLSVSVSALPSPVCLVVVGPARYRPPSCLPALSLSLT